MKITLLRSDVHLPEEKRGCLNVEIIFADSDLESINLACALAGVGSEKVLTDPINLSLDVSDAVPSDAFDTKALKAMRPDASWDNLMGLIEGVGGTTLIVTTMPVLRALLKAGVLAGQAMEEPSPTEALHRRLLAEMRTQHYVGFLVDVDPDDHAITVMTPIVKLEDLFVPD